MHSLRTRGATLFVTSLFYVFASHASVEKGIVTTFFMVMSLHGNHPSTPTYLLRFTPGRNAEHFLRLAAHEGVPGGLIHSELPLCFGSLSGATSHTLFAQRGSDCYELAFQGYQ